MFTFFKKTFQNVPATGRDLYIRRIALIFLIILSALLVAVLVLTLHKAEIGYLLVNPGGLLYIPIFALPYLLPALLAALFYKLHFYKISLTVVVATLIFVGISWQFAYQNRALFAVYAKLSIFFEEVGMLKVPLHTLIPDQASFPSGIHSFQTVPYYDRYYLRANYPAWELGTTGKDAVIRGGNINIEYSFYPGKYCTDISGVPSQSDAGYKDATFQNIQCRENMTCTTVELLPEKEGASRNIYIYMDDKEGCVFLRTSSPRENMFTLSKLMSIINTANRAR